MPLQEINPIDPTDGVIPRLAAAIQNVEIVDQNIRLVAPVDTLDCSLTDTSLSANQGRILKEQMGDLTAINNLPDKSSLVAAINSLEARSGIEVENTLNSDSVVNALSAKMGKDLDSYIGTRLTDIYTYMDENYNETYEKSISGVFEVLMKQLW